MLASFHGIVSARVAGLPPSHDFQVLTGWFTQNLDIIEGNNFWPNSGDARAYNPAYIGIGGSGEIWGRSTISIFGLDPGEFLDPYTSLTYCAWRDFNGKVGTYNDNTNYTEDVVVPENTIERLRCDGKLVHFEYSLDEGETWSVIMPPITQISERLYPKISTDPGEHLLDFRAKGLIIP